MERTNQAPRVASRFSMRYLLLVVGVFACLFSYLSYFRPARATVVYAFLTVESSKLEALSLQSHSQEGSAYSWACVDQETASLLWAADTSPTTLLKKQVTIHSWPMQAETASSSRPVFLDVNDPRQGDHPAKLPTFDTALFGGFLGVRRAGRDLQFRVEGITRYQRTENGPVEGRSTLTHDQILGEIFYEGKAPEHALVFIAPLDEHSHHVILFTVAPGRSNK